MKRVGLFLVASLMLAACSGDKKDEDTIAGDRIAVLKPAAALKADEASADTSLTLGDVPAFSKEPKEVWRSSIGSGSESRRRLISMPIVAGDTVYTLDTRADVRAFALADGNQKWQQDLAPDDSDDKIFGGGLTVADATLYVTTGFGELLALDAASGKVQWRVSVPDVVRTAPVVADDRVYVMTASHLYAFDAANGSQLWVHSGIAETSALLGAATPTVVGDVILAAYNSGELYAIRAQTGKTIWSQSLAASRARAGGLALSDINANPVVVDDKVYAISSGGRMAAIDMRTGQPVWDADVGGVNAPIVSGSAVFVLADGTALAVLDATNGRAVRVSQLPRYEDEEEKKGAIVWNGPVLAGDTLWLTNSGGQLVGYGAGDGNKVFTADLPGKTLLPPIFSPDGDKSTLIVLTDDGQLVAYR